MVTDRLKSSGIGFSTDEPLSHHSTFRIGGVADVAVFPSDIPELIQTIDILSGTKFTVIGGGSNIVFPSDGYRGTVVFTKALRNIVISENKITAECGVMMPYLSSAAMNAGLSGLEFLCGIPGTIGGGVRMNAGSYGREISDCIESCKYYDTEKKQICLSEKNDLGFSFRSSIFADTSLVVLSTVFALTADSQDEIRKKCDDILSKKRSSQPYDMPSAGSVFKPIDGIPAWKLIDECKLRGYSVGGAKISEKHAGFIVNTGNATSDDVKKLTEIITDKVFALTGKIPEEEIIFLK